MKGFAMKKIALILTAFMIFVFTVPSHALTEHVHTSWGTGWTLSGSGSGRCTGWATAITDLGNIIVNPDGTQQPDEVDINCSGGQGACASINSAGQLVTWESVTIPATGQETTYDGSDKLPVLLPDQIRATKNEDNKPK